MAASDAAMAIPWGGGALAHEEALAHFLRASSSPAPALERALEDDPDCIPALRLQAGMAVAAKNHGASRRLDAAIARLAGCGGRLSPRDRAHLAAARAWRDDATARAAALYSDIVRVWPHDLLALRLAQSCHYFLGDSRALHEVAAGAAPFWRAGMPDYDCWLAMHAFGLEEIGECARAEAAGRRALEIEPRNAAAVHAVAHVFATRAEHSRGLDWLARRLGHWSRGGAMVSHNWWHVAQFHLALGAPARALAVYDTSIAPALACGPGEAAALLWQLSLAGTDPGRRWHPVADALRPQRRPALWPLADVQAACAFAGAGRKRDMDGLLAALAAGGPAGPSVALPFATAVAAFAAGDYATTVALLERQAARRWRLGGSRLQQDLVVETLVAARRRARARAVA